MATRQLSLFDSPQQKRCGKCGEVKPRDAFSRHRKMRDGLQPHCKSCFRAYFLANAERIKTQRRDYYHAHREQSLANTAKWQRAHKSRANATKARWLARNPEKRKAAEKKWRDENPENCRARSLRWHRENPDKSREKTKRWLRKHPGYKAAIDATRAARRRASGGDMTARQWRRIKADALGLCAYCNQRRPLTLDHIDPIALGGSHSADNAAAACLSCNSSKNDTPLLLWLARRVA